MCRYLASVRCLGSQVADLGDDLEASLMKAEQLFRKEDTADMIEVFDDDVGVVVAMKRVGDAEWARLGRLEL